LVLGEVDVVLTATDNVLNYRYKRRSDNNSPLDVRIVRAVELGGGASLVAARATSLHDLRGALIAVDDTDSGFALLLYELLARAGMVRGLDYRVVAFGGTPRRFEGLVDGDFDATMLNAGFDLRAADRGVSFSGRFRMCYLTTSRPSLPPCHVGWRRSRLRGRFCAPGIVTHPPARVSFHPVGITVSELLPVRRTRPTGGDPGRTVLPLVSA
jgi:hypothetical protein